MDAEAARAVERMTKAELALWLHQHGTIWPSRASMAREWSKDELVRSVIDRMENP